MNDHDGPQGGSPRLAARRQFLQTMAAAGAGAALAGAAPLPVWAAGAESMAACGESVQDLLNMALAAEHVGMTFYYIGLTAPAIVRDRRIAGASGDPNAVARNGSPHNVADLQAALDQEQKHAQILANAGATSPYKHFYFPALAFHSLGFTSHPGTYMWMLDHIRTSCVSFYLAVVKRFGELDRADLAVLTLRILGVECEHRALFRVVAGDDPADNVTLEVAEYTCPSDAARMMMPMVTGRGYPRGAVRAVAVPTPAQVARVVGKHMSSW